MTVQTLRDVSDTTLTWPQHKERASRRIDGTFKGTGIDRSLREIRDQLSSWGVRPPNFVISRNTLRAFAGDPGVTVWWIDPWANDLRVLACDRYDSQAKNGHAIALTIEALRAVDRHACMTAEEASRGAKLLMLAPPDSDLAPWRDTLGDVPIGIAGEDALLIVNGRYRKFAMERATDEGFIRRLNLAIEAARKEFAP